MTTVAGLPIPQGTPAYLMTTTRRTLYVLDANGNVLARSNGPRGWTYSGKWTILGATTRHLARRIVPLADIARDGVPGQGWLHDLDHGTHRLWGTERMLALRTVQ